MDDNLYESICELNHAMSEYNSKFIYESIMLESSSEPNVNILTQAWGGFIDDHKKAYKEGLKFIEKTMDYIKDDLSNFKVKVTDRSDLLKALRKLHSDNKFGYTAFDNIVDGYKYYDFMPEGSKPKMLTMRKREAIFHLKQQLEEANSLIYDFNSDVDRVIKVYEKDLKEGKTIKNPEGAAYKIKMLVSTRDTFKKLINEIVDEIQQITVKKRWGI